MKFIVITVITALGLFTHSRALAAEALPDELITFYTRFDEKLSSLKGDDLRAHLLSLLPSDREIDAMFAKHSDLAKTVIKKQREAIRAESTEQLAQFAAEGPIISISLSQLADDSTIALQKRGIIRAGIASFALIVERKSCSSFLGYFAKIGNRWVTIPDIVNDLQGNLWNAR
jgi:hypothetical protein